MTGPRETVAEPGDGAPAAPAEVPPGAAAPAPEPVSEQQERSALVQQMGGVRGLVDSGLPALVFVTVNILVGLGPAVASAVVSGVAVFLLRLARRESVQHAVSGFLGLALAAFIAQRTGRAEGFFLPGIVMNCVYATGLLASVALRRPLVGIAVAAFEGRGSDWRLDDAARRVYARASIGWAVYFLGRAAVALALFDAGSPVGLLVLRLTGVPMMVLAVIVTVAYTRRAARHP